MTDQIPPEYDIYEYVREKYDGNGLAVINSAEREVVDTVAGYDNLDADLESMEEATDDLFIIDLDQETQAQVYELEREMHKWPIFAVTGRDPAEKSSQSTPVYWRISGPNGPVQTAVEGGDPEPATMIELLLEAQTSEFRQIKRGSTPWRRTQHKEDQ